MRQAASEEFGYQPSAPVRRRTPLSPDAITAELARAGLEQLSAEMINYTHRPDMTRAWLEVPIFADTVCPGLPYEQQLQALELAATRYIEPTTPQPARWYVVVATATATPD